MLTIAAPKDSWQNRQLRTERVRLATILANALVSERRVTNHSSLRARKQLIERHGLFMSQTPERSERPRNGV